MDLTPSNEPAAAPDIRHSKIAEEALPASPEVDVDTNDIQNCVALFLGRKAEVDLLAGARPRTLSTLIAEILNDEEFRSAVLRPVLLREPVPQASLFETPPLLLIDWAQRRLPIEISTRRSIGAAGNWSELLELLLADASLIAVSQDLKEADVDRICRSRIGSGPLAKLERSVIGAVDAGSAFDVRGWAVDLCDKSQPVIVEFYADGSLIGFVTCGESRPDVQDVVGGTGRYGFTFKISPVHRAGFASGRTLTAIDSISRKQIGNAITVSADATRNWDIIEQTQQELMDIRKALQRIEERLPEVGKKASIPIEAYGEYWERFYRLPPDVLAVQRSASARFGYRPKISIVTPTWNSDTRLLHRAIESVRDQSYEDWELILTDDFSDRDELRALWRRYANEPRIRILEGKSRGGISVNTNRGVAAATGDYIAFLDHDDELAPDALYEIVLQLQERRYGLLYSDEDRIEEDEFGRCAHHTPFFKPDHDPDLLLALNYICHLVVVRADVIAAIGGFRSGYDGAQDHDLLLRVIDSLSAEEVLHIPRVLYHWRVTPGSVSRSPQLAEQIKANIVAVVDDHLQRHHSLAKVEIHNDPVAQARVFATRVRWFLPLTPPKVSVIIATRDRVDLLRPCVDSILDSLPLYPGEWEVLIVDNDSCEPASLRYFEGLASVAQIRVLRFRGPFNWSAINNHGAREASGEVLVFLNNDTVILTKDWCTELAANAMRTDIGAVGARLIYADGTIQHAGVLLGIEGVAGHEGVGEALGAGGYFGRSQLLRSAAAVTGACLATRREIFEGAGGFDDLALKVAFNDVDYCMKVRKAGYRVIYNPFVVLYHLESKSRGREISEAQITRHRSEATAFRARWSEAERVDPYYNPHFELYARPFDRLRPPPEISRHHPIVKDRTSIVE